MSRCEKPAGEIEGLELGETVGLNVGPSVGRKSSLPPRGGAHARGAHVHAALPRLSPRARGAAGHRPRRVRGKKASASARSPPAAAHCRRGRAAHGPQHRGLDARDARQGRHVLRAFHAHARRRAVWATAAAAPGARDGEKRARGLLRLLHRPRRRRWRRRSVPPRRRRTPPLPIASIVLRDPCPPAPAGHAPAQGHPPRRGDGAGLFHHYCDP